MQLTVPELALVASTRGLLGAGIGLLAAGRLPDGERRALGWALFTIGALSTIPLFFQVFRPHDAAHARDWRAVAAAASR